MLASEYNVFRTGFLFTVIRPRSDEGLLPGLIYWNDRKVFLSEVELSVSIVPIEDECLAKAGRGAPVFQAARWAQLPEIYFK